MIEKQPGEDSNESSLEPISVVQVRWALGITLEQILSYSYTVIYNLSIYLIGRMLWSDGNLV